MNFLILSLALASGNLSTKDKTEALSYLLESFTYMSDNTNEFVFGSKPDGTVYFSYRIPEMENALQTYCSPSSTSCTKARSNNGVGAIKSFCNRKKTFSYLYIKDANGEVSDTDSSKIIYNFMRNAKNTLCRGSFNER